MTQCLSLSVLKPLLQARYTSHVLRTRCGTRIATAPGVEILRSSEDITICYDKPILIRGAVLRERKSLFNLVFNLRTTCRASRDCDIVVHVQQPVRGDEAHHTSHMVKDGTRLSLLIGRELTLMSTGWHHTLEQVVFPHYGLSTLATFPATRKNILKGLMVYRLLPNTNLLSSTQAPARERILVRRTALGNAPAILA